MVARVEVVIYERDTPELGLVPDTLGRPNVSGF